MVFSVGGRYACVYKTVHYWYACVYVCDLCVYVHVCMRGIYECVVCMLYGCEACTPGACMGSMIVCG